MSGEYTIKGILEDAVNFDKRHKAIHEGNFYSVSAKIQSLGAGETYKVVGITGSKYIHIVPPSVTIYGSYADVIAYENVTGVTGGSSLTPKNNYFEHSNVSTWTIKGGVTIAGQGDEVWNTVSIGGSKSGGSTPSFLERVLSPYKTYSLEITNRDNSAIPLWIMLEWYETLTIN